MVENEARAGAGQHDNDARISASPYGLSLFRLETSTYTRLAIAAAVTIAYFLTGKLGLRFALIHPSASAIWAPSGLALTACLLFGSWTWPAIAAGAFLVNATTYGSIATSIAIAIGNTAEALTGAYLVRRFAHGQDAFTRTADTFRFVLFAAVLSTTVSATIGVTSLCTEGYAHWSNYAWIWFTWVLGDATGDLIIAPLLILWACNPRIDWDRPKIIEAVLLMAGFCLTAAVVFGGLQFWGPEYPNAFLCIQLLLWVAFRFGPCETATLVFFLSVAAVTGTANDFGPFSQGGRNEALLLVQTFVAVVGTSHLIVAVEVAERRRLDQARARLGAVVESSDDAIIAIRSDGCITDWNAGATRLYGFSAAEAVGNPVSIIIPADRFSESAALLARINNGETIAPVETVGLRKDGTRTDISLSVSPIKEGEGRIIGASKIARDITQLKQARQEREALLRSERAAREAAESARQAAESARQLAEAASRAKDEFLAMLGHELRNPLHAISLASQLLQNPNSLDRARSIIARQGEHMMRLVEDLLDAARVTSGRIALIRRPLNLAELVSEYISNLKQTGQLEHHTVETDLQQVWVDADSERLSQVIVNLLGNAMKYTPRGGKIWVRVKGGDEAILQVQDNGTGISSELLPHIFDLFARGEFGLQRSPAGLGIGLTLVQRIAELHGGRAEAASDGPGRGSTFTVGLPIIAAPQACGAEPVEPNEPVLPRRILLIEDNADARESLRLLLETLGHQVFEANDGPAGVKEALAVKPEFVLIDLGLPGFDGYEVAARIRAAPACNASKLIALTGYAQNEFRRRAQLAGFHDYLTKPVDADTLVKALAIQSCNPTPA
jgi:PAS domain S-box-containing protein